jgi:hypothetical protein
MRHSPPEQPRPAEHVVPHAPQFCGSDASSLQKPPHFLGLTPAQLQTPAWQLSSGAHAVPHALQFSGSDVRSLQTPLQRFAGAQAHAPLSQVSPGPHVAPSSTTPLQSLSSPSQLSFPLGVH